MNSEHPKTDLPKKNSWTRNRWLVIGGILLLVIIAAFVYNRWVVRAQASAVETATVTSVTLSQTVDTSGTLNADQSAELYWQTTGTVANVNVEVGDHVEKGDVLLSLEKTSLPQEIITAEADLADAQKELDDLLNSATSLAQAKIDLKDAQEAYDKAVNYLKYLQNSKKVPQTETRYFIETKRNSWQYVYKTKTFKGPAPEDWIIEAENDLALKKGELEDAQREYDRLLEGENSSDVAAAQARVDAAQAAVNQVYILAPFGGEVIAVYSQPGDVIASSSEAGQTLAAVVVNRDSYTIQAQVDEADISQLKVGQPVEVTLDALPDLKLEGEVSAVNVFGQDVSGVIKYDLFVTVQPTDSPLPLGGTANIAVQVSEPVQALAVPIAAIRSDTQGEYVLRVNSQGAQERVNVQSGEIVGGTVTVTGDLQEGDQVLLATSSPNPFGGGGGGPVLAP